LPQELGFSSDMTCWRRLRDWQAAGAWAKLHLTLLQRLREHNQIDWSRISIDGVIGVRPWEPRKPVSTRLNEKNSASNATLS